jgi:tetratricopeptide (TPR) repeat protein
MNKKYINYIIVGVMVVILVIAGLIDYKRGIDKDIENIDLTNISDVINNENEEVLIEGDNSSVLPGSASQNTTTKPKVEVADINKVKFNTALSNGSTAFNTKDYSKAVTYFNEALSYNKSDVVYVRLFSVYSAQGDWIRALEMINEAIVINPSYTDYWIYKLVAMDEKTNATFGELKTVYNDGLAKVDPKTKINLMTNFARIAENNGEKSEAISVWTEAQKVYPQNQAVYQTEIDRLNSL